MECAKYSAWRKRHKDIITFSPEFEPEKFSKVFFRKEYDDGIYDPKIFSGNVEYGGRAFSDVYKPFDEEMEHIEPDFSAYWKYKPLYGKTKHLQEEIRTILYSLNIRLSLDGKTLEPFPYDRLQPKHPNVLLHDYDIANIPNAFELLYDISGRRPSGLPYRIGNKYPINVYTFEDLMKWFSLPPMSTCFFLQYNNVLTDEQIIELCEKPIMGLRQLFYNFTYGCSDENDFVKRVLPEIYKQTLFLRSHKQKILLNITDEFFKTRELYNLMKLIVCFYGKNNLEWIRPHKQTLYAYCAHSKPYIEMYPWRKYSLSVEEMREAFQYMRRENYDVFDMFYSTPNVIALGGKLVNEWERNSFEN